MRDGENSAAFPTETYISNAETASHITTYIFVTLRGSSLCGKGIDTESVARDSPLKHMVLVCQAVSVFRGTKELGEPTGCEGYDDMKALTELYCMQLFFMGLPEWSKERAAKQGLKAETGAQAGRYTEEEIEKIIENLKGDGFKNNPLRQAYENEVKALKEYGEELLSSGVSEEQVAQILNQARRDLGIKYKDMTPQPLRGYIYEINMGRYDGDKLGPTYDALKAAGKSDTDIINSASRPNLNIDQLLSGFEERLRRQ